MNKLLNKKYSFGFSLFEVVITMAVVAIFVACCSNVFTQKHKKRLSLPAHGRFECYWDDSSPQKLLQKRYNENTLIAESDQTTIGYCEFVPPRVSSYLIVNAVAPGGYGGSEFGGEAGAFSSIFLSATNHYLRLKPGVAASSTAVSGGVTKLEDIGVNGVSAASPNVLANLKSGVNGTHSSSEVGFTNCRPTYQYFTCRDSAACSASASDVSLTYCESSGDDVSAKQKKISKSDIMAPYAGKTAIEMAGEVISYCYKFDVGTETSPNVVDLICFAVDVDGNWSGSGEDSKLFPYITALGLDKVDGSMGKLSITPGNGGGTNTKGGDGAVLVVW